jgi:hypothetical protein
VPTTRKILFLDLDETLIHARYIGGSNTAHDAYKANPQNHIVLTEYPDIGSREVYRADLRPGAVKFISDMQKLYGVDNVFILTAAIEEYARKWNLVFGLGIPEANIVAREDYHIRFHCFNDDTRKIGVLVDNLPSRELETKHAFLNRNDISHTVVTVNDFLGAPDDDVLVTDYIKKRIKLGFDYLDS